MRITAVRIKTFFGRDKHIRAIHSGLFHGLAFRGGIEYPSAPSAYLTNDVREPLELVRPGNFVPQITRPDENLVCLDEVVRNLRQFTPLEFLPVTVSKIVDFWVPKGDMTYYRNAKTRDIDGACLLKLLPDSRASFPDMPELWELLVPRLSVAAKQFDNIHSYKFHFGEAEYADTEEFSMSREVFEKYPVVAQIGITMFRADVFSCIARFFDEDFFHFSSQQIE
ncbi:MAG: hypothetical protein JWM11_6992 [Planctomycetaceae bacterium]|nr:hypothetical protein [Planctomycetaceae bacterium]